MKTEQLTVTYTTYAKSSDQDTWSCVSGQERHKVHSALRIYRKCKNTGPPDASLEYSTNFLPKFHIMVCDWA